MDFRSIDDKELKDGRLRMTEPKVLFDYNTGSISLSGMTIHEVEPDEVGRPDKISYKYFQDDSFVEYILKYNKISNPFSIDQGDVLVIPDVEAPIRMWKKVKEVDETLVQAVDSIRSQFLDTKRMAVKDAKRVEYLKKKASSLQNGSKEILPPNILQPGTTNLDITDDSITI